MDNIKKPTSHNRKNTILQDYSKPPYVSVKLSKNDTQYLKAQFIDGAYSFDFVNGKVFDFDLMGLIANQAKLIPVEKDEELKSIWVDEYEQNFVCFVKTKPNSDFIELYDIHSTPLIKTNTAEKTTFEFKNKELYDDWSFEIEKPYSYYDVHTKTKLISPDGFNLGMPGFVYANHNQPKVSKVKKR